MALLEFSKKNAEHAVHKETLSKGQVEMRVLLSWIGAQDPWRLARSRPPGELNHFTTDRPEGSSDGPILSFLANTQPFDFAYLLYDPSIAETGAVPVLTKLLADSHPLMTLCARFLDIDDPRSYDRLYREMRAICHDVFARHGSKADYNVFLSPGTPQMHAIWILLTKTDFPATAWQGSDKNNKPKAEVVTIPFDFEFEVSSRAAELQQHVDSAPDGVIGTSLAFRRVIRLAKQAANSDYPVLITGETGVGKEEIARLIHCNSARRLSPLIRANCTALPANLVESTLFGHVRGAFTGAIRDNGGLFAAAQGGTLFLDEIAELSLETQPKLLHVLQDRRFTRVGDNHEHIADVRIIAATHRPIDELQAEGTFREDLYYRLNVIRIFVPPLRDRREDIPALVEHFVCEANRRRRKFGKPPMALSIGSRRLLVSFDWPGNVRQLENHIKRLDTYAEDGRVSRQLTRELLEEANTVAAPLVDKQEFSVDIRLRDGFASILENVKRQVVQRALQVAGTQQAAARLLGFSKQQNVQYYLSKRSDNPGKMDRTSLQRSTSR